MKTCIDCKFFKCEYTFGYAKEDSGSASIYCSKEIECISDDPVTEKVYKEKINPNPTEYIWDLTDGVLWNTDDFREIIKTAEKCRFYKSRRIDYAKKDGNGSKKAGNKKGIKR